MTVKSAQIATGEFATSHPSTGAAVDADSLPTAELYVNKIANEAAVAVASITTGVYSWSVTLPTLAAGDRVGIRVNATVNEIAGAGIVWEDVADTARTSDVIRAVGSPMQAESYVAPDNATITAIAQALAGLDFAALTEAVGDLGTPAQAEALEELAVIAAAIKEKTDTIPVSAGTFVYTVTSVTTGLPIAGVHVFATTDAEGANVVCDGYTDAFGVVRLPLDAGTWHLWRRKAGYHFDDPDIETIEVTP